VSGVRSASCALAALLLAPAARGAACDSTAACLQVLAAAQASTRTFDARFVQTKHVSLLDEPLVSTGRIRFRRPDHVRLDLETPQAATILIAARSVTVPGLAPSEQRAMEGSPMASMFTELGALFAGSLERAPAHFDVAARADGDAVRVTLSPTAPDYQRLFRTIALRFAGPEMIIQSMRLDDALGDRLEVELRDVRRNVELPDAVFVQQ
jgi:outer membrane lipoprotein-sorting protein